MLHSSCCISMTFWFKIDNINDTVTVSRLRVRILQRTGMAYGSLQMKNVVCVLSS